MLASPSHVKAIVTEPRRHGKACDNRRGKKGHASYPETQNTKTRYLTYPNYSKKTKKGHKPNCPKNKIARYVQIKH